MCVWTFVAATVADSVSVAAIPYQSIVINGPSKRTNERPFVVALDAGPPKWVQSSRRWKKANNKFSFISWICSFFLAYNCVIKCNPWVLSPSVLGFLQIHPIPQSNTSWATVWANVDTIVLFGLDVIAIAIDDDNDNIIIHVVVVLPFSLPFPFFLVN